MVTDNQPWRNLYRQCGQRGAFSPRIKTPSFPRKREARAMGSGSGSPLSRGRSVECFEPAPGLRALIAATAQRHRDIKVDVQRLLLAEPLRPQPGTERIAATIARHAKIILGVDVPVTGVPLYTDARHYAAAAIPIVLTAPGRAQSSGRTRTTPTRTCGSRTCAPPPRSSRSRSPICAGRGEFCE